MDDILEMLTIGVGTILLVVVVTTFDPKLCAELICGYVAGAELAAINTAEDQ